jgi:helicase
VVDEVHLLGDARRGPRLEGALLRIRCLNPLLRLLALSATMVNADVIADWLDALMFADR